MDMSNAVYDFCNDEDEVCPLKDSVMTSPATEAEAVTPATSNVQEADSWGGFSPDIKRVESDTVEEQKPAAEPRDMKEKAPAPTETAAPPVAGVTEEQFDELREQLAKLAEQNAELSEQILKMSGKQLQMLQKMEDMNRAVAAHEAIEKRMGDELNRYKKDFYGSIAEPFITQLITLHISLQRDLDGCQKDIAKNAANGNDPAEAQKLMELSDTFKYYVEVVEGSLSNCGVEVFRPEAGELMDNLRHQIVKTVPTENAEKQGYIESVRSAGYAYNGKILRQSKVVVYKVN